MIRHILAECLLSLKTLFRQPGFWVPTVLFPAMMYSFFGARAVENPYAANAIMVSFCLYAVLGVGFYQFGVTVAQDRESPFATWQRSLPGAAANQWIARIIASLVFVTIAVVLVIGAAHLFAVVDLALSAWVGLGLVCALSVAVATILGIALGSLASARAAVPIANLIYLPISYLGGLWMPPSVLPSAIQVISEFTPTRAMGELGWAAIGVGDFDVYYVLVLAAWLGVALVALAYAERRNRGELAF